MGLLSSLPYFTTGNVWSVHCIYEDLYYSTFYVRLKGADQITLFTAEFGNRNLRIFIFLNLCTKVTQLPVMFIF